MLFKQLGEISGNSLSVAEDLKGVFIGMIAEGSDYAGQRGKQGVRMLPGVSFGVHFFKNQIKMSENFSFNFSQFFKQFGIDGTAQEKIHHHLKILIVECEVLDKIHHDLFDSAIGRLFNGNEDFFKYPADAAHERLGKQRLLVRKVAVDQGGRYTGTSGDVAHGDFGKGLGGEFFFCRVDDNEPAGQFFFFF